MQGDYKPIDYRKFTLTIERVQYTTSSQLYQVV